MKKTFFFLILIALSMNSCFDQLGVNVTPEIILDYLLVNPKIVDNKIVAVKDTLLGHYNDEFGMAYVDTLQLGDTVMFKAVFDSYPNNLVNVSATVDTTRVKVWFLLNTENQAVQQLLADGSDPQKGILFINPMYSQVSFPIFVLPQEAGSHPIKITVVSDSKFSTNAAIFTLPVK